MIFNLYDINTGEIVGNMHCSANVASYNTSSLEDGIAFIESEETFDGGEYYLDIHEESILTRPEMTATIDKTTISADGVDEATITNIPENSTVIIGEAEYTVTDGEAVIAIPFPGTYSIVIKCFPYKTKTFELIAE